MSVTLEAAYSVPEAFVPTEPPQNYMACLQVPAVGKVSLGPGTARCEPWNHGTCEQTRGATALVFL